MSEQQAPGRSTEARARPLVSVGLPVYNGEPFLAQSLDALLSQSYENFELVISDNASTDATAAICKEYAARDPRVRYLRQPENIGAARNHNVLVPEARGTYFKWAAADDLYAPELLELCVDALEQRPDVVLAHCDDAYIDEQGQVFHAAPAQVDLEDPSPSRRLRNLLYQPGGNDFYGVIRTEVLRRVPPHGTYYNADRTFMAGLVLQGPVHRVPATLFFRRDHPGRATRAGGRRARAAALGPERADRLRYPMLRMHVEYLAGFLRAVRTAPLSPEERRRAHLAIGAWALSCLWPGRVRRSVEVALDSAT